MEPLTMLSAAATGLSALGSLFGSNKPEQVNTMTPEQRRAMQLLMEAAENPYEQYGGDMSLSPQAQLLMEGKPLEQREWGDYYSKAVEAPERRRFEEETLPGIQEDFAGVPGTYWGGARAEAMQKARERFGETMAAERARTMLGAEQMSMQGISSLAPSQVALMGKRIEEHRLGQKQFNPALGYLGNIISTPQTVTYEPSNAFSDLVSPLASMTRGLAGMPEGEMPQWPGQKSRANALRSLPNLKHQSKAWARPKEIGRY